jgi:hypothetical protein
LPVVAIEFIEYLKADLATMRKDLEFYRGKCERLELAIMNSDTKREAAVEFVERTDEARPSIRTAVVPQAPPRNPAEGYKTPFAKLREKWDSMTPAEQAIAQGQAPAEPEVKQV